MKRRYLEVTFHDGKPLAAYLHLPHATGAKVARTTEAEHGLCVDFDADGAPIGVEITAPAHVTVDEINAILVPLGIPEVAPEEWAPLAA